MKASELKQGQIFKFKNSPKEWFVMHINKQYMSVYQSINRTITFKNKIFSQATLSKDVVLID